MEFLCEHQAALSIVSGARHADFRQREYAGQDVSDSLHRQWLSQENLQEKHLSKPEPVSLASIARLRPILKRAMHANCRNLRHLGLTAIGIDQCGVEGAGKLSII